MSKPGEEWVGRSYSSLERPAEYFGCHINIALAAVIIMMSTSLSFAFVGFMSGVLIFSMGGMVAAVIVKVGRSLSRNDPFWPDAVTRHYMDGDDYLDV